MARPPKTEEEDVEATPQPLPTLGLPEFEGIIPIAVQTTINGSGQRITRPLHHGEKIILIIEAEVNNIAHPRTKDGIKRQQVLGVEDMYELAGERGRKVLSTLRTAYRLSEDKRTGNNAIAGWTEPPEHLDDGLEVTVDKSGTQLLPHEAAALRGDDPIDELIDEKLTPAVLVFDDGLRALWPADYAADVVTATEQRPTAGGEFLKPRKPRERKPRFGVVREILNEAGETLEEWTDEDEDARLAELEDDAKAKEAADDPELLDLDELSDKERERGRCGEIFATGDDEFAVCTREKGHPAAHVQGVLADNA